MKLSICLLALVCPFLAMCQPATLKGKVVDENNEPIAAATITLLRTHQQYISAKDGTFIIEKALLKDSLLVTATGYETRTEVNNERGIITITLNRSATRLQEVTVSTGYQQLPRERVTGSFSMVDNSLLNRSVSTDITTRLQGLAPGESRRLSAKEMNTLLRSSRPAAGETGAENG